MREISAISAEPADLRQVYGCFPSGVTAMCALRDSDPIGMVASAFTPVSIEPPLVSVCVQNSSTTWPKLRELARIGVSILAEHQGQECRALAMKVGDRFAGVSWKSTGDVAVVINEASAWLDCSVYAELAAGDHAIVLLEIHGFRLNLERNPLVFHASRFRQLVDMS